MLRFNFWCTVKVFFLKKFQYILCYGSTTFWKRKHLKNKLFQYILCYGSTLPPTPAPEPLLHISIHPMLRFNSLEISCGHLEKVYFNTSYVTVQRKTYCIYVCWKWFQYILCYGSTCLVRKRLGIPRNFNTSYVTVQHAYVWW